MIISKNTYLLNRTLFIYLYNYYLYIIYLYNNIHLFIYLRIYYIFTIDRNFV